MRIIAINQETAEAIEIRVTQPHDEELIEVFENTPESELKYIPVVKNIILDKWTQIAFDHPHVIKVYFIRNYQLRRV